MGCLDSQPEAPETRHRAGRMVWAGRPPHLEMPAGPPVLLAQASRAPCNARAPNPRVIPKLKVQPLLSKAGISLSTTCEGQNLDGALPASACPGVDPGLPSAQALLLSKCPPSFKLASLPFTP